MIRWVIFFLAFSQAAFGQEIIEGKIVDAETGKPISFASVIVLGTSRGTSSNVNGEFSLTISPNASLKITCIGYESKEISAANHQLIQLKPVATQLNAVVVFDKAVVPKKIVRRAFANIDQNYSAQPFLQKFFYRHYCKDDSAYGRVVEAFVDVWKGNGYHSPQKSVADKEGIRVTQLRRSLDKTTMAQGHEPISIGNILHADIVGYQSLQKDNHMSFFSEVSNLKTEIENYSFSFEGVTTYDGQEVYEINYTYKKDSALLTSGKFLQLTQASGLLFITTDTYAFVKSMDVKRYGPSVVRSSAYYRKYDGKYYPYHFIREGENHLSDSTTHSFHIDLMSVDVQTDSKNQFVGSTLSREELLQIPYDSVFWNSNAVLKTTPLEDEIIHDLGGGVSLNKQFYQYRQYDLNTHDGGKNGAEKFKWFRDDSKGKRNLYLFFWSGDFKSYFVDLEQAKRLQKKYRNKITFVLLSTDDDEERWQQTVAKFGLYADGIINYRVGKDSETLKAFNVNQTPAFFLIPRSGEMTIAKRPGDPLLERDFQLLLEK